MGISYDPPSKKWNIVYEKTDNPTNLPINTPQITTVDFSAYGYKNPIPLSEAIKSYGEFNSGARAIVDDALKKNTVETIEFY